MGGEVRYRARNASLAALLVAALWVAAPAAGGAAPATSGSSDGIERLVTVASEFLLELGASGDPGPVIEGSSPPDTIADGMASVLERLLACHQITEAALPEVQLRWTAGLLFDDGFSPPPTPAWADELGACGEAVVVELQSLAELVDAFVAAGGTSDAIDVWPVLRFEPANAGNRYEHDYVLAVDAGGDDEYFNNAGGNGIDVRRGPTGSGALEEAPARGCETAGEAVMGAECVLSAAAVLDSFGNDIYGRFQSPNTDAVCTADPVVRRILVQGAAAAGVGVLLDRRGDDGYTGKVLTTGTGHINGVGHLRDEGGEDTYRSIRIAHGAATVGGTGTLFDLGGEDVFDFYVPRPLDPDAENLMPGAGGVLDDQNRCDRGSRIMLGAGNLGGTGHLNASGGDDSYTSSDQDPRAQGSGSNGGVGTFIDSGGGHDTYLGVPGRADNTTLLPTPTNQGFFQDS